MISRLINLLAATVLLCQSVAIAAEPIIVSAKSITAGAAQTDVYLPWLLGKKVGVVCNHTSVFDSVHLVDVLVASRVNVVRVFAPEHGFRGSADAGEHVNNTTDSKTGLPIVSLYGAHKKPTEADLADLDVLVFDIQDVGARFYTYISTMLYAMEACAEFGVEFIVLDRPNPNGFYVDGPLLTPECSSFVGALPIPVVHGMTVAELAMAIKGEGWGKGTGQCSLRVVPCLGYEHRMVCAPPIAPSPNLQNLNAVLLYPSLCFFEGTDVSVARGTSHPFEAFGHPQFAQGSFVFVPRPGPGSKNPPHNGAPCVGWDLREIGAKRVLEVRGIITDWMVNAYRDFPNKEGFFLANGFIDKLAGTTEFKDQVKAGFQASDFKKEWAPDLQAFKAVRAKYLLYPDFE